jgi:cell division protein FtsI/penicillin-binding protein 2
MQAPAGYAQIAADTVGAGDVRVSPLDMALAAGLVESGSWYPPSLVTSPPDPGLKPLAPFGTDIVSTLRSLMRATVASGAGAAANVAASGKAAVYGQVGSVPLDSGRGGLHASWFVGFRGNVAFAVLIFAASPDATAAPLAGQFARGLTAGS